MLQNTSTISATPAAGTTSTSADKAGATPRLAAFLQDALDELQAGTLVAGDLKTNGRLSRKAVAALAARRKLKFSWNTVLGNPVLYPAWRRLKFAVEGITMTKPQVAGRHASLIANLRSYLSSRPTVSTSSELYLIDAEGRILYKAVTALSHAPVIWQLAGLDQGRCNYDYWSDQDLVKRAAGYATFTALKEGDDALHRMLKGRGLERQVLRANPAMVNHFYVSICGDVCRSVAELVASNYLHLRGVAYDWEPSLGVCRPGSKRSMVADAYLHDSGLFLECAQNLQSNRGSRREHYAARIKEKVQLCKRAGLRMVVVDGDRFTRNGVLEVAKFASEMRASLLERGQDIGPAPAARELLRSTHDAMRAQLIQGDWAAVMACLAKLGIDGIAKLQNHHAHILTCLKVRDDCQAILDAIKARSNIRRWGHPG